MLPHARIPTTSMSKESGIAFSLSKEDIHPNAGFSLSPRAQIEPSQIPNRFPYLMQHRHLNRRRVSALMHRFVFLLLSSLCSPCFLDYGSSARVVPAVALSAAIAVVAIV